MKMFDYNSVSGAKSINRKLHITHRPAIKHLHCTSDKVRSVCFRLIFLQTGFILYAKENSGCLERARCICSAIKYLVAIRPDKQASVISNFLSLFFEHSKPEKTKTQAKT